MARITHADLILDALVTAQRAVTGYRSPTSSTAGITVYDGPEALLTQDRGDSHVIIGYGGEDQWDPGDPGSDAVQSGISIRAIATTSPKAEEGTIECFAQVVSGDMDVSAVRTAVVAIGTSVDGTLRTDPKIGIAVSGAAQVLWTQVTGVAVRVYLLGTQLVGELRFTLTYSART